MTADADGTSSARRRTVVIVQGVLLAAVLAILIVGISPAPYVVERPGPVYDTLGTTELDGEEVPVISVDGAQTFPTDGSLDLLTVYLDGSRDDPIDWFDVLVAWLDPSRELTDIDLVYPEGQSDEEADEESALDMQQSQQSAVAAALGELGIAYQTGVSVGSVSVGTPADGVLEPGDELLAIDGTAVASDAELRSAIADAGVGAVLAIDIRRDGSESTVEVTTVARSADDDTPIIGVVPLESYTFPFQVDINLGDVGGPSAGMMFALGIYDTLTPGALTGGEHIAGTGTIDAAGEVGAIGGIRQKMIGARDAGAEWFLAPADNCSEVVGSIPDGLEVFSVSTLEQAIDLVEAIGDGSSTDGFARCG
ncbi:MAG: PDZ domain-containing protein [Protaetiibacter sp.]